MNQRLAFFASLAMLVAVIALCATTVFFARENRAIQREMLARLEAMSVQSAPADPIAAAAITNSYDWPVLEVTVVDEVDGKPLAGVETSLRGRIFGGDGVSSVSEVTDAQGVARLGPTKPGGFDLSAKLADGFRLHQRVTVRPGPGNRVTLTPPRWEPSPEETRVRVMAFKQQEDAGALVLLELVPWVRPPLDSDPTISGPAVYLAARRDGLVARISSKAFRRLSASSVSNRGGDGEYPVLQLAEPGEEPLQWTPSIPLDRAVDYSVGSDVVSIFVPADPGTRPDEAAGFIFKGRGSSTQFRVRRENGASAAQGQSDITGATLVIEGP